MEVAWSQETRLEREEHVQVPEASTRTAGVVQGDVQVLQCISGGRFSWRVDATDTGFHSVEDAYANALDDDAEYGNRDSCVDAAFGAVGKAWQGAK